MRALLGRAVVGGVVPRAGPGASARRAPGGTASTISLRHAGKADRTISAMWGLLTVLGHLVAAVPSITS